VTDATSAPQPGVFSPDIRAFLDAPRFAVVATINPDGSSLQAVAWYLIEGDSVVFNSKVGRRWPSNLVRDPRVAFTIADGYSYVELRGRVEIDDDPERGVAMIVALARRYEKDPAKLDEQIAMFRTQRRVTFRLRIDGILEHFE